MYTCVRALLRRHGGNQRLIETTVNVTPVRELVATYETVVLVLTNPALAKEVALDLAAIEDIVYTLSPTITVDAWLFNNGSATLPTTDVVPKKTAGVVKSRDLFVAGYHAELSHPTEGAGTQAPDYDLTNLLVTRGETVYKDVFDYGLFTVNGLCHIADYSSAGVYIKGGGRSVQYANRNMIGLNSFLDVGKLTCYPIVDNMILPTMNTDVGAIPLKEGILLKLPTNIDLSKKAVMVSLAGVLFHSSDHYRPVGKNTILLDWPSIPVMELFYNVRPFIDMSTFEAKLGRPEGHGDALDLNMANRDDSIKAFLKLPQSFIITVDTDNFFCDRIAVERTDLPGRYYHHERPRYPLQLENGFLMEYMTYNDDGVFVLAVDQNRINRYAHQTRPYKTEDNYVTGARQSSFPDFFGSAYLLEMGRDYLS